MSEGAVSRERQDAGVSSVQNAEVVPEPASPVFYSTTPGAENGGVTMTAEITSPLPQGGETPSARQVDVAALPVTHSVVPPQILSLSLSRSDWRRILALSLAAAAALYFLWMVQSILLPFILSFFLAALLDPTLRSMESHGYSRVRAILTLYLFVLCMIGVVIAFIVPRVATQINDLSLNYDSYYATVQETLNTQLHNPRNMRVMEFFGVKQENLRDLINQKSGPVQRSVNAIFGGLTAFLQDAVSKFLWLIIIPVATFFLMRDYRLLRARFIALFPEAHQERVEIMTRSIVDVFSAYIRGLAEICVLYGVVAYCVYWLFGLKYALFLGMLAGMFYAVPYVGQIFAAIAVGAVAFSMPQHTALFFLPIPANSTLFTIVVVLYGFVAQVVFDQLVYPRIVGGSVGLHPVVSIFALMAGATLMGIWGMLIAVPVAASIQILIVHFFPRLIKPLPPHLIDPSRPLTD